MNIIQRIKAKFSGGSQGWIHGLKMGGILIGIVGVLSAVEWYANWRMWHEYQFPIVFRPIIVEIKQEVLNPTIPIKEEKVKTSWIGLASYYSHEGCVGCSDGQVMSNGKPFIEDAITIAFNDVPLGTFVRVINLRTNVSIVAEVTDTGGFNELGRLADLSKGTKEAIGCSDMCEVEITIDTSTLEE